MATYIRKHDLDLQLVAKEEPIDYFDSPDGRMFILVLRKTSASCRQSCLWLIEKAERLKDEGNAFYKTRASSTKTYG